MKIQTSSITTTIMIAMTLLVGCRHEMPSQSPIETPGPSPLTLGVSPLPTLASEPGKGSVVGHLAPTLDPLSLMIQGQILLGGVLKDTEGTPIYAYANAEISPAASWDPRGFFYFENVAPGEYSIVYWTPEWTVPFVLYDGTERPGKPMVIITVAPGEQVYAGMLEFPAPSATPLPPP